jgi:hypothetical protein
MQLITRPIEFDWKDCACFALICSPPATYTKLHFQCTKIRLWDFSTIYANNNYDKFYNKNYDNFLTTKYMKIHINITYIFIMIFTINFWIIIHVNIHVNIMINIYDNYVQI